jgi:hypothetical protein
MGEREFYNKISEKLTRYFRNHLDTSISFETVKTMNESVLHSLLEDLSILDFYSREVSPIEISRMKTQIVYEELEKRHKNTDKETQEYYRYSLLGYEKWEEATSLASRSPILNSVIIPKVIDTSGGIGPQELGYFTLNTDLKSMYLKKFDWSKGPKIILYSDCHFGLNTISILQNNIEIIKIMKDIGIVVGNYDFFGIDSTRKKYPDFEIHPLHHGGNWFQKGVDTWSSPSILFLKDGIAKYQIIGLNEKYLLEDFCRGLEAIDQLKPNFCK